LSKLRRRARALPDARVLGLYLRMMVLPVPPDLATATAGNLTTTAAVGVGAVDGVCRGKPGMGDGTMGVPSMRAALLAARDWLDAYAQWSDVVVLLVRQQYSAYPPTRRPHASISRSLVLTSLPSLPVPSTRLLPPSS